MKVTSACTVVLTGAMLLAFTTGCSSKNYVRSQTQPVIDQTNQLDAKTATDHRTIMDTDERAQKGITKAQGAADTADQHATAAGQSAATAGQSAQEAYNRVDTLNGVIANLDNYKPVADVSVTFGFDKSVLTAADKKMLDDFASGLADKRSYILAVTGGTDSTGDANYNYGLSQRRADAVVNYLSSKYNVAPHKFYLIGIGKDQEVASNNTSEGRAKNRRVEVKLMTNMDQQASSSAPNGR
jgi:outer membrane protein OmpA-like peptidoglycan-associated protein